MKAQMVKISQLRYLDGNRSLNDKHIAKLKQAISKNNLLHLKPILINKKFEILDGQHRVEAAKELGHKEIACLVYEFGVPLSDVQAINMLSQGWSIEDYAKSFAAQGLTDYAEFLDYIKRTGLGSYVALAALSGSSGTGSGGARRQSFLSGSFKVKHKKFAEDFVVKMEDFKTYKHWDKQSFQMAVMAMLRTNGYSHSRMVKKLSRVAITLRNTTADYIVELEEIYNHHERSENRLKFRKDEPNGVPQS